ncbi:MAG TPA: hypothetical protein VJ859_07325 [Allosphingosinicella sp.]|nr:hypothetical protein [Allosphingosinicella sp.]
MVLKGLIAATASIALMAAPAVAAGSAPASAAPTSLAVQPAGDTMDGMQLTGSGNIVIILLAAVAVGLGIWALLDNGHDKPTSP